MFAYASVSVAGSGTVSRGCSSRGYVGGAVGGQCSARGGLGCDALLSTIVCKVDFS